MNHIFSINSIVDIIKLFLKEKLHRSAAALSYFLVMTIFPMLICVQWILSTLGEDIVIFLEDFSDIIPSSALSIFEDYLSYTGNASQGLLIIGAFSAIYTGASAFRMLTDLLQNIFESHGGNETVKFFLGFFYSVAFLLLIYCFAIIVLAGKWLINLLEPLLAQLKFINLLSVTYFWNRFRFIILNIASAIMLWIIYYSCSRRSPIRIKVLPGAILGSVLFTFVSSVFSWFISSSVNYSAIYGSLASVIILMLWLYLLGNIIIIGALFNKKISDHRNDPKMKIHHSVHKYIKKKY